jgi:hypothetical protein
MFRQRSVISGAWFGCAFGRAILVSLFGMDRGNRRFQIFQRQSELGWLALLRPPPKNRILECHNQFFQPFDPLILAQVSRLRGDQYRLQRRNF